jgi:prepilin-type N-terminal cleavage/methylation domain-containing protein
MRRVKERADAGFTLIEVLVALCMLGLISSYSLAALQNLRRMDMIIERLETRSSIEAIANYLDHLMSGARPVAISIDHVRPVIAFAGEETKVEFVAAGNAALEIGGLLSVTLEAAKREDGLIDLVTTRKLFRTELARGKEDIWPLYEGVKEVKFRYFGRARPDQSDRWHESWANQSTLPKLIEIVIKAPDGAKQSWPRLVIRLASAF